MLAHRLWPIHNVGNPSLVGKTEKGYQLDFTGFDHNVKFYLKHGQGGFGIGVEWPPG